MIQYGAADILMRVVREEVRRQELRIKDLAKLLKVSEPTVKRYLAGKGVTLEIWTRMYEVLGLDLRQVADRAGSIMVYQETFTEKQELAFCKTPGLYAFHHQLFHGYSVREVMANHKLTEKSAIFYLKNLDNIGLIQWKTGIEYQMSYAGEPNWRKNGPLARKYKEKIFSEFVFEKKNSEHLRIGSYLLTSEDLQVLRQQATSILTAAWRAEQSTKYLKSRKLPVSICILADEYERDFESYIPNIR